MNIINFKQKFCKNKFQIQLKQYAKAKIKLTY